jgi:hypothetical protein
MNNLRKRTPLWKWILLIVFGSAFFFVLSQVAPVACTFSNKPWIKAALLLLVGLIVLVLYTLHIKKIEKRKVSELKINRALPDLLTGFAIGTLFIATVVGVLAIIGIYRVESIQVNWVALLLNFAFLWIPIGIHWAWNFMLGPIFGSSVSGNPKEYNLIIPEISGPYILTGGSNGLEGSIVTCCIGILFGIFLLYYGKRGKRG